VDGKKICEIRLGRLITDQIRYDDEEERYVVKTNYRGLPNNLGVRRTLAGN
jgi:hypothetical protein